MNIDEYETTISNIESGEVITIAYGVIDKIVITNKSWCVEGEEIVNVVKIPRSILENFLRMINES